MYFITYSVHQNSQVFTIRLCDFPRMRCVTFTLEPDNTRRHYPAKLSFSRFYVSMQKVLKMGPLIDAVSPIIFWISAPPFGGGIKMNR